MVDIILDAYVERNVSLHIWGVPLDIRNRLLDWAFAEQRDSALQVYSGDLEGEPIDNLLEEFEGDEFLYAFLEEVRDKMEEVRYNEGEGFDIYFYPEVR